MKKYILNSATCKIHRPVCWAIKWKCSLRSREQERLKRLPCQISAINFTGNSAAITLCARRGQRRNSLTICACVQIKEREDLAESHSVSLKIRIQSSKATISVWETARRNKQKERDTSPWVRLPRKLLLLNSVVDTF